MLTCTALVGLVESNMDKCLLEGCRNRYGIVNGYCRIHAGRAKDGFQPLAQGSSVQATSSTKSLEKVSNNDLKTILEKVLAKLDNISLVVAQLQQENVQLTNEVADLTTENENLKKEVGDLKINQNVCLFRSDAQNQYSRHESFRVHKVPEVPIDQTENCSDKVIDTVSKIGVHMTTADIQRCHRLGKRRTDGKPRAIICKTTFYPLKKKTIDNRKDLTLDLKNKTIAEQKEDSTRCRFYN